jgi:hypothetical protein
MGDSSPAGYYAFERNGGGYDGLVRVSDVEGGGKKLDNGATGGWVNDQSLLRFFTDPGSDFLSPISTAQARLQAKKLGLTL